MGCPYMTLPDAILWYRRQEKFAAALFSAYLKGEIAPLAVGDLSLPENPHFVPFDVRQVLPAFCPRLICWPAFLTGEPNQSRFPVF
jgi:hypothetical protein